MANLTNHINLNPSGGGVGDITAGDAIRIDAGNEVNVKFDGTTIVLNDNGELMSACCEDDYPKVCVLDEEPTTEGQIVQDNCYDYGYYKAIMTGAIEPGTRYLTVESTGQWTTTDIGEERFYDAHTTKEFEVIKVFGTWYAESGGGVTVKTTEYTFPTSIYKLNDENFVYNVVRNTGNIVTDIKTFVDPDNALYSSKGSFLNSALLTKGELQQINQYKSGTWGGWPLWALEPLSWHQTGGEGLYVIDNYYNVVKTFGRGTTRRDNSGYFYIDNDGPAFSIGYGTTNYVNYGEGEVGWFTSGMYSNGSTTSGVVGHRRFSYTTITLPVYQDVYGRKLCYIDTEYENSSAYKPSIPYRTWYLFDESDKVLGVFYQQIHDVNDQYALRSNEVRMTFGVESEGIPGRLIWSKISGASLIDYSGPILQATDVNGAINELAQSVNDIEHSMPDPYTAGNGIDITNNVISANISTMQYDNSVSGLTSTNVKDAIDELSTKSNMPEIRAGNGIVIYYPGDVGGCEAMIGPCDQGYHVPTGEEFQSVLDAVGTTYSTVKNILHLPLSGFMAKQSSYSTGAGYLWTCTPSGTKSKAISYGPTGNITIYDSDRRYLYPVRAFKDKPVTPDSSWTETMSDKVWENSSSGLISVLVGTNKYITLQDKNVGATEVFNGTDNDNNRGQLFQRGNSYGFTWRNIPTATMSKINAGGYAPSTYNSNMCVNTDSGDWSSVQNDDLWGGVTGPTIYDAITIEAI